MTRTRKTPLVARTASRPQREHYAATHNTATDVRRLLDGYARLLAHVEDMNRNLRNALDVVTLATRRQVLGEPSAGGSLSAVTDPVVVRMSADGELVVVVLGGSRVELTSVQARQLGAELHLAATTAESAAMARKRRDGAGGQ